MGGGSHHLLAQMAWTGSVKQNKHGTYCLQGLHDWREQGAASGREICFPSFPFFPFLLPPPNLRQGFSVSPNCT